MYSDSIGREVRSGNIITGKWHKKQYQVIRELGNGANGQVFLVVCQGCYFALKLSENANDLAIEYQLLKEVQAKTMQQTVGPTVFELDDWVMDQQVRFFYVMEYVKGKTLEKFIVEKGSQWIAVMISQVLRNVHTLHTKGYAYGDLKLDNCLAAEQTATVRMIDFGGVTPFGKGVRQYTEWTDRAWWGQGTRKADVGYDAFAIAMMIVQLLMPVFSKQLEAQMQKTTGDRLWQILQNQVQEQCREKSEIRKWLPILKKAWLGSYGTLQEMRDDVLAFIKGQMENATEKKPEHKKTRDWTDYWLWIMVAGSVSMFLFFYLYNF